MNCKHPSLELLYVRMVHIDDVRINFSQRLAQACVDAGIEEHGRGVIIAKRLGITPKAVSKWLNAESMPRQDKMEKLAAFLDVDVSWLQFGKNNIQPSKGHDIANIKAHSQCRSFPVIELSTAGSWQKLIANNTEQFQNLNTAENASDNAFWVTVNGDSMIASSGFSFPEGMHILVDPDVKPHNKVFVLSSLNNLNEITFKQFIDDAGSKFLKPLNTSSLYQPIPITDFVDIIGVVVDAKWKLK